MDRKLEIGSAVVFITAERVKVNALIEYVHHSGSVDAEEHRQKYGNWPCVNLMFLSPDPNKVDQHGRQKERASSVSHGSVQGTPQGYCWLWPDE